MEHIGDSGPVHGQDGVGFPGGLVRRSGARIASGIVRQLLKIGLASCVGKYHFMASPRRMALPDCRLSIDHSLRALAVTGSLPMAVIRTWTC